VALGFEEEGIGQLARLRGAKEREGDCSVVDASRPVLPPGC
jgi:hypothetical protein